MWRNWIHWTWSFTLLAYCTSNILGHMLCLTALSYQIKRFRLLRNLLPIIWFNQFYQELNNIFCYWVDKNLGHAPDSWNWISQMTLVLFGNNAAALITQFQSAGPPSHRSWFDTIDWQLSAPIYYDPLLQAQIRFKNLAINKPSDLKFGRLQHWLFTWWVIQDF